MARCTIKIIFIITTIIMTIIKTRIILIMIKIKVWLKSSAISAESILK